MSGYGFMRGEMWMRLGSAVTNATPCVPGNGRGSVLERVAAAKNITSSIADPTNSALLNDLTSMAIGQLVMTTDGFWGTIVDFPNTDNGNFTTSLAADTLTKNAHGIVNGTVVYVYRVGVNVIPAPLIQGKAYFVVGSAANTLQLSLTSGGAAIDITGADTTVGLRVVSSNTIIVDRWRNYQGLKKSSPAAGAAALNFFPAGSILASAESIQVNSVVIDLVTAAAGVFDLMDWTAAAGAFQWTSNASLNQPDIQFGKKGLQFSGPFTAMVSDKAVVRATVVFTIN